MNEDLTKSTPTDWRTDAVACWHRLPNKGFFFTLLAAWLALFQFWGNSILGYVHTPSLFAWLNEAYNSAQSVEDAGQGDFIPFLVAGIFWWKRNELLALPLKLWWPGILLLAAALFLHVAGYLVQQPLVSTVALFAGIYALTGLAWGRQWLLHSVYPFFLFVFSIPLASHLTFILFPLQVLVSWLVEMVSHLILGIDIIRHGTELFDPSGSYGYRVEAACSGMRSLIAVFLLATVYGFATFRLTWQRILLMALAFPFAVLGNLARMMLIVIAAEMGGQEWGNYVHEGGPFGIISLLPYIPAIAGLLLTGRLMEKWQRKNESAGKERA